MYEQQRYINPTLEIQNEPKIKRSTILNGWSISQTTYLLISILVNILLHVGIIKWMKSDVKRYGGRHEISQMLLIFQRFRSCPYPLVQNSQINLYGRLCNFTGFHGLSSSVMIILIYVIVMLKKLNTFFLHGNWCCLSL